jgi:hypothetical protein
MTDSLRAEVDRIIDQHFEPSVMGRIQVVDELMEVIKVETLRAAEVEVARMLESQKPRRGPEPIALKGAPVNVVFTGSPTPPAAVLVEEVRIAQQRAHGGW